MVLRISYRSRAEADLVALLENIADHSPKAAQKFFMRVRSRCDSLADFPEQGPRRDDLGPGLRLLRVDRLVCIGYRILPDKVEVVRILYADRDIDTIIRDEELRSDDAG